MQECLSKLQEPLLKISEYRGLYSDKALDTLGDADAPKLECCDIEVDISRQRIMRAELDFLHETAKEASVIKRHKEMMDGSIVNVSENRAALHTLLRDPTSTHPDAKAVKDALEEMRSFSEKVRSGKLKGATGKKITNVINVGIGGSFNGPYFVWKACRDYCTKDVKIHWISNVDGWVLDRLLSKIKPAKTLVIVSSKSFETAETLFNASTILKWFKEHGINKSDLDKHFVVCSTDKHAGKKIGVPEAKVFPLWNWVGGRFSVWSSIGLPVMIAMGAKNFDELLKGAHQMDQNSQEAPKHNLSLNLALLEVWNSVVLGVNSLCVLPYEQRLEQMIPWLQQLEMESLGKSVLLDGTITQFPTGGIVWGCVGNDAQHTFFQYLRQGTARTGVDIIYAKNPTDKLAEHHRVLLANAKAQANALVAADENSKSANAVSIIKLKDITPFTLGALMAMYENKTTMIGTLLGINPFDQPGVDLGKKLTKELVNNN